MSTKNCNLLLSFGLALFACEPVLAQSSHAFRGTGNVQFSTRGSTALKKGASGFGIGRGTNARPTQQVRVSYAIAILDEDANDPHWADYQYFPTEGQAITAARSLEQGGYRTQIRTVEEAIPAAKSHVLFVRDPESSNPNWTEGGRFATAGEAVAAQRAATSSGLETSVNESQKGKTTLPPIQTAARMKRALLYQVFVARYQNLSEFNWVVVYETFDPGSAQEAVIRIRSSQHPYPGQQNNPPEVVRVASKEVMVDEATYRKSFPNYP